ATATRRDDRGSAGERFDQNHAEALRAARQHEERALLNRLDELRERLPSLKLDAIAQAQLLGQLEQARMLLLIPPVIRPADEAEPSVGAFIHENAQRTEQDVDALHRPDGTHEQDASAAARAAVGGKPEDGSVNRIGNDADAVEALDRVFDGSL